MKENLTNISCRHACLEGAVIADSRRSMIRAKAPKYFLVKVPKIEPSRLLQLPLNRDPAH
jgi:hypothetical protein